jgi:prevent-host-death family protein
MAEMKAVGVKELKARLSEYLRHVKAGETVLVTERNEVVAELRPARRQPLPAGTLPDQLDLLAEAGQITRAGLAKGDWTWQVRGLGLAAGTAQGLLDAVRADRDPS